MAQQIFSLKSTRSLFLAATFSAAALAGALSSDTASAFGFGGGGFRGGGFGGFHGGFSGGGIRGGGFGGGGFHKSSFGGGFHRPHYASIRGPGRGPIPIPIPEPGPRPGPHCFRHRCGPIGGPVLPPPVLVTTVGALSIDYYYGDQPIYYHDRMIHAFSQCDNQTGTFVLIGFVPTATSADISAFLQAYKVAIIDGPDQESIYVIKLADRKMSEKEVHDEMVQMQAEKSVVRLIVQRDASVQN